MRRGSRRPLYRPASATTAVAHDPRMNGARMRRERQRGSRRAASSTRSPRRPGADLLDLHADPHHNRSVLTLVGEDAPAAGGPGRGRAPGPASPPGRAPADRGRRRRAVRPAGRRDARRRRRRPATGSSPGSADELGVPGFAYGPERTLPDVRRRAFRDLAPDAGPPQPHPTAGAVAVGARDGAGGVEPVAGRARPGPGPGRGVRGARPARCGRSGLAGGRPGAGVDEPGGARRRRAGRGLGPGRRAGAGRRAPSWSAWCRRRCSTAPTQARWAQLDLAPDRTIEARLRGRPAQWRSRPRSGVRRQRSGGRSAA